MSYGQKDNITINWNATSGSQEFQCPSMNWISLQLIGEAGTFVVSGALGNSGYYALTDDVNQQTEQTVGSGPYIFDVGKYSKIKLQVSATGSGHSLHTKELEIG